MVKWGCSGWPVSRHKPLDTTTFTFLLAKQADKRGTKKCGSIFAGFFVHIKKN
jgi:hypothetical protein